MTDKSARYILKAKHKTKKQKTQKTTQNSLTKLGLSSNDNFVFIT